MVIIYEYIHMYYNYHSKTTPPKRSQIALIFLKNPVFMSVQVVMIPSGITTIWTDICMRFSWKIWNYPSLFWWDIFSVCIDIFVNIQVPYSRKVWNGKVQWIWWIIHDSPKLKPSKLARTVNNLSADILIDQTFFCQMLKKRQFAKCSCYTVHT